MQVVERSFVEQMIATFERIFKLDENEFETMKDHSASMRRVFSRYKKFIPVIGRDGGYFKVMPHSAGSLKPCDADEFRKFGPYKSETAYIRAVKETSEERRVGEEWVGT